MSKTITIELADEVYAALEEMSHKTGRPVELLALERLTKRGPQPTTDRSESQRRPARSRLLQFAGTHHGSDPRGSENERTDADLASEYERRNATRDAGT